MSIAQGGRFGRTFIIAARFWLSLLLISFTSTTALAEPLNESLNKLVQAEYFIDELPGLGGGHLITIDQAEQFNLAYLVKNISATQLSKGLHTLAIRFQNSDGEWSSTIQQSFFWPGYKGLQDANSALNPLIKGEVFFDDEEMLAGSGSAITLSADGYLDTGFERLQRIASIKGISAGVHTVSIKFLDSSGIWSTPLKQSFYVYGNSLIEEDNDNTIQPDETYAGDNNHNGWFFPSRISHVQNAIAYFDDNPNNSVEISLPSDEEIQSGSAFNLFNALATTTNLTTGVHSFHISFQDNVGEWSQPIAQSILINPTHLVSTGQNGNRLVAARYRLDDNSTFNLTAQDGAFDDIIESIEKNQAVNQSYHHVQVNFLDLSGQWTDPSNNTTQLMENDSDGNGISDQWELTWFGQIGINPNADYDNDGISNLDEFLQGKHPLLDDTQTALTISGYVKDAQGNGIPHILVCIENSESCTIRTDVYGHYTLGLSQTLVEGEYTILARSTSASGLLAFTSTRTVSLTQKSVERVNFTSSDLQLTWSFVANEVYNPNDSVDLQWQSNAVSDMGVVVELKRDLVTESQTDPDNLNWYRFSTFTQTNGQINFTIPEGLNFADDWRVKLSLVGAEEPKLSSAVFQLAKTVAPVPEVEIELTSPADPMAEELITASVKNVDTSKTIIRNHWSAVRLVAGVETGESVLLGEENTMRTKQLSAGEWRLYLQSKDESEQWSARVSKDIYVSAIEGLADLAINQTAVKIINSQGNDTYTVSQNEAVTLQVKVTNGGTVAIPDKAWVIVRDGIGNSSVELGRAEVTNLAADTETTVNIPISTASNIGYQTLAIDVQFDGNINTDTGIKLAQPTVAESNRFNNATSTFLIVGNPPAGSFGIDLTSPEVFTVYTGQSTFIYGQANYSFGSRMPLMGTQVYIDLEQQQQTGRTTSPAGKFAVQIKAPLDLGDHEVNITVNGGYMQPARKTVILRVIPWPTIESWHCDSCTYTPPPPPAPLTDLVIKRITLSGDGVYRTDHNSRALVQNKNATVTATIYNSGNLPVAAGFNVSFYYLDEAVGNSRQEIGDTIIVNQSLAVNQKILISSSTTFSFEQLGYRQVFAEISQVSEENNTNNNQASIGFDVRENRADLRGNTVNALSFSNKKPVDGESIRIFASILNRGPAILSDTFTVDFYDGNPSSANNSILIDSVTFSGTLEKWQTTTLAINWIATNEGGHSIYAVIDADDVIDEDTEDNNIISSTLQVIPDIANLHIALSLSDYSVKPGTEIVLSTKVTNKGTQPSAASEVKLYFGLPENGGEIIGSYSLAPLNTKTTNQETLTWNTAIPHGSHNICAVIVSDSLSNGKYCQILTITDIPVPDLQVYAEDITYQPGPVPSIDDQVLVSANIRNVSAYRNARNITVQFYADSPNGFFQIGNPVTVAEIALKGSVSVTATQAFVINQPYYALKVEVIPSAEDGDANLADNAATTAFPVYGYPTEIIDIPADLPTIVSVNDIEDGNLRDENGEPIEHVYNFSVTLSSPLPTGYGVFLNFDNQQGEWFEQNQAGGHIAMPERNGNVYKLTYQMKKPGLRSFRAGIFDLKEESNVNDDILVVGYTEYKTCTLPSCQSEEIAQFIAKNRYGNPALSGSGSLLFKNVDVASRNYHLAVTDIATSGKGPTFAMTRAYNSLSTTSNQWTFAYQAKATFVDEFNRKLTISPREDGRSQSYFKDMDQKWYALNPGNFSQLVEQDNGSFTLYTKGNRLYRFAKPDSSEAGQLLSIEDRLGNALTFDYVNNNLVGAIDANGNKFIISRDENNRIKRVTDFANRFVEYGYNDNGMITSVRNVLGNTYHYAYGTTDATKYQLTSMIDPRGELQFTVTYNSNNEVTQLTQGDNTVSQITASFSSLNNNGAQFTAIILPEVNNVNHNVAYVLDKDRTRIVERIDAQNYDDYLANRAYSSAKQEYTNYNNRNRVAELGLVKQKQDEKSNKTTLGYSDDGKGNVLVVKDAKNRATHATYADESVLAGQTNLTPITRVENPSEANKAIVTQYQEHTFTGKPKRVINPRGDSAEFAFGVIEQGANEWLTTSKNARGFFTYFNNYDANGNATSIVDAKGSITNKEYDELSRLTKEVSPLGLTTTYAYDLQGNIKTKNVQANGGINYTTQYFYNASNKLTKTIGPLGHAVNTVYDNLNRRIEENYQVNNVLYSRKFTYDNLGRLTTTTNERDEKSTTYYTARNKVSHKVNPLLQTTVTYTYDKNGNVSGVTDADNRTITTVYDELNRKTHIVDDERNQQQWSYNLAGQVASYIDSRNETTYYEYDLAGNLIKLTDTNNGITRSTYDANNNLSTVTGPNGQVTEYNYDELDRKISTIIRTGAEQQKWQYNYDANGNMLIETMPTDERIVKTYDALNRVTQLTEYNATNAITRNIAYEYDANSNVTKQSNGTSEITYTYDEINRVGSVTDQFGQTISYGYDKAGNRTSLTYPGDKTVQYAFDKADRLAELTDWLNNTTNYTRNKSGQVTQTVNSNGTKANFTYDKAGRLTLLENLASDSSIISRHQLTLDGAGNIKAASVQQPLTPELPVNFTGTFDSSNRIVTAGNREFIHDQSGRIVEQTKATGSEPATTTIYQFDINDQLTSISINDEIVSQYGYDLNNNRISQQQLQAAENTETRYVIDQLASLPNVIAETNDNGEVSNYYIYGEGLVSKLSASGDYNYYHYDPTGHTLALSNDYGFVSDKYAYTPYGKTTQEGTTHNPFLFVGKNGVMDDGNGLHFMRARYYKEDIKRFISLDALHGEMLTPQSLNRYAYVLGNPVMGIDPSGNITFKEFAKNYKANLISLGKHIGNDIQDTAVVAGRVGMDVWDVYIYEPADAIVNDCSSNNEGVILKSLNCVGSVAANAAGAGLDVINPTTAMKASLREPIRIIAGGDEEFEKELIAVADTVFALWSIRKAARQITHASNSAAGAKKAVETIQRKIKAGKSARGLAANMSNYNHHVIEYLSKLTDLIKAYESGIKLKNFK